MMTQRWQADGSGKVAISFKKPREVEEAHRLYDYEVLTLSVVVVQTKVDEPPRDDRRDDWQQFLDAVRPPPVPPTAQQLAAIAARNAANMANNALANGAIF